MSCPRKVSPSVTKSSLWTQQRSVSTTIASNWKCEIKRQWKLLGSYHLSKRRYKLRRNGTKMKYSYWSERYSHSKPKMSERRGRCLNSSSLYLRGREDPCMPTWMRLIWELIALLCEYLRCLLLCLWGSMHLSSMALILPSLGILWNPLPVPWHLETASQLTSSGFGPSDPTH